MSLLFSSLAECWIKKGSLKEHDMAIHMMGLVYIYKV